MDVCTFSIIEVKNQFLIIFTDWINNTRQIYTKDSWKERRLYSCGVSKLNLGGMCNLHQRKLIMKKNNHFSNFFLLFCVLFEQFVDDVEFWFPPNKGSTVEYRSASRLGNFDFDLNRKRIKVWLVLSSYHVLSLYLKKFLVCRKKLPFSLYQWIIFSSKLVTYFNWRLI